MSKYTTQLRWPLEQFVRDSITIEGGDPASYVVLDESQWPRAWKRLGLSDYPIWDEGYRDELNRKIVRRYFYNEIGQETVQQFAWFLRARMHEIMPYYNRLYKAIADTADPFVEIDMKYTNDSTVDSTSTSHDEGTSDNRNVFSDTPMTMLEPPTASPDLIEQGRYATNVTDDNGKTVSDGEASGHNTVDQDRTEKGRRHSLAWLIKEHSDGIMNIDQRVIDDLGDLFMFLW